jgi:hypothetical protein
LDAERIDEPVRFGSCGLHEVVIILKILTTGAQMACWEYYPRVLDVRGTKRQGSPPHAHGYCGSEIHWMDVTVADRSLRDLDATTVVAAAALLR